MPTGKMARVLGAGAATAVLAAVSLMAIAGPAGALSSGDIVPSSAIPGETFTANTPFSSGQLINVAVPANSLFNQNQNINVVECTSDAGSPPPDGSYCDGNTIQGVTLKPRMDGSIDLHAEKNVYYTLFALPDQLYLGESPGGPECDLTTECYLYIGTNQNDFTAPHVWSQGFYVAPNSDDGGPDPGDGSAPVLPTVTNVVATNGPLQGTNQVTVTGTGFALGDVGQPITTPGGPNTGTQPGASVEFGGRPATSVNVTSQTSLTATVPAGANPGLVSVSAESFNSGTSTTNGSYTYNAPPTVTNVNPNNGVLAGGNQVTLTGTGFVSGQTTVAFGANAGTGVSVTNATTLTVTVPAGVSAGSVPVTATTTSGGTSTTDGSYIYNGPPTITGVNPSSGVLAGGNQVTLTGTGFVSGQTTVAFGANAGTGVSVTNATTLTVTVPAGATTGAVSVSANTTTGGPSSINGTYTYNPLPTVTGVNLSNGPLAGGNQVTVTGTGFVSGQTSVAFGTNAGTGVSVTNATTLTVTVPAGSAVGPVSVSVTTTGGGTSTTDGSYTYNPLPTVTGVNLSNGPLAGGNQVTVTGTGFVSGQTTVHFGANVGTGVSVTNATTLTVTVPAGATTGPASVSATTTSGGTSTTDGTYTYNPLPTVTGVNPNNGVLAGGNQVTLTGTGFAAGQTTVDFGASPGTGISVLSPTGLSVTVPAGATAGPVAVSVVTTSGGTSTTDGTYTYNGLPTVTGVNLSNGPLAGGNQVTLTGTGFSNGLTIVDFGSNSASAFTELNDSSVQATVPAGVTPGPVAVSVVTTGGGTSTTDGTYTYNPLPTVTGVNLSNGPLAGGNQVTVTGTGFVSGQTTVAFGASAGTGVSVTNATTLTVTVPAGATAGAVSVSATTTGWGTSTTDGTYTYNPLPTVTGVNPNNGVLAGGNQVTLTGTGFVSGQTTVDFGASPGTGISVFSPTGLSVTVPAGATAGQVSVSVTTASGGASTTDGSYTYNPLPTVTAVAPNNGPQAGGNQVTLTGTGFTGASAVDFGGVAGTSVNVVSDTSITVTVPAHVGPATVAVSVTTPSGGTSTTNGSYTYNPASPVVTGITPASGPAAGGTAVTITGSGLTGASSVLFGSTPATNVSVNGDTSVTATSPAGSGTVDVTVVTPRGTSPTTAADQFTYVASVMPPAPVSSGYDLVGRDGGVFVFPTGQSGGFFGSLPGLGVSVNNIVGMVPTSDDQGYFLVGSDGGVFAFGDAPFENSLPGLGVSVNNIVGIVPTTDNQGYFLVGADGGVYTFGDAPFLGSLPGIGVHVSNIIGIAANATDTGYWLVATDGTVYAFGAATNFGSATGGGSPVTAIQSTPDGGGYWIVSQNGAVASFGDAVFFGSLPGIGVNPASPVIGLVPTADQGGYWLIGADGGIYAFGDAPFVGSLPGLGVSVNDVVGAVPTHP